MVRDSIQKCDVSQCNALAISFCWHHIPDNPVPSISLALGDLLPVLSKPFVQMMRACSNGRISFIVLQLIPRLDCNSSRYSLPSASGVWLVCSLHRAHSVAFSFQPARAPSSTAMHDAILSSPMISCSCACIGCFQRSAVACKNFSDPLPPPFR